MYFETRRLSQNLCPFLLMENELNKHTIFSLLSFSLSTSCEMVAAHFPLLTTLFTDPGTLTKENKKFARHFYF